MIIINGDITFLSNFLTPSMNHTCIWTDEPVASFIKLLYHQDN